MQSAQPTVLHQKSCTQATVSVGRRWQATPKGDIWTAYRYRKRLWQSASSFRLPVVQASQDPAELVQESLIALRRADANRLSGQLAPGLIQLGDAERQVLIVGGQPIIETGPLANFADVVDTGARRLLPGNLLRRCRVLSTLQVGPAKYQQRIAVTACTGEEGVLDWILERQQDSWWVASIRRDTSGDTPPPESPHPRLSPEAVILGQLDMLKRGDLARAAKFHVFASVPHGADMSERAMASILESDNFLPILGHEQAELGASALPTGRSFVQEVSVTSRAGIYVKHSSTPTVPEAAEGPETGKHRELIRASYVWTMCLRDSGCWMVQTVQATSADGVL